MGKRPSGCLWEERSMEVVVRMDEQEIVDVNYFVIIYFSLKLFMEEFALRCYAS